MDKDCIFCRIANGEIPSNTVYEDEDFRAILDLSPLQEGHTLLIPKKHCVDLFDLPEEIAGKALPRAKKIAEAIKKATGCDGFNLLQNNGEAAGQSVMHFHLHIIPRKSGDTALPLPAPDMADAKKQEKLAEAIRNSL